MSSPEVLYAKVLARIWQAIAKQGITAAQIPQDKLDALANEIASGVMAELGAGIEVGKQTGASSTGQPSITTQTTTSSQEEQILWEGRPLLSLTRRYVVTTQRIRIITGLLSRSREDIELIRIQDLDQKQRFGQRLLGIGTVYVDSADPSSPHLVLKNIRNPLEVHEIIRRAMLNQRRDTNFAFRQEFRPLE
jgi:hypothetical protein